LPTRARREAKEVLQVTFVDIYRGKERKLYMGGTRFAVADRSPSAE
jgi:hypothetical protein